MHIKSLPIIMLAALVACTNDKDDTGADTAADTATDTATDVDPNDVDDDGDGFTENENDCDDTDAGINPDAEDVPGDEIDQDCDGEDAVVPSDADEDGVSVEDGDCDDANADINPSAEDTVGDEVDNNCDGVDGVDGDADGVASIASGGTDCDDANAERFPGNAEIADDLIDQDCEFLSIHLDTSCTDMDADGTPDQIDSVVLTGPWWGWDTVNGAAATDADGDGIWTVEFENVLTEALEYKWVVNGSFEPDLVGAGYCADKTNPSNPFTNRLWLPGDGDTVEYPGTCLACDQTDWTWQAPVTITLNAAGATAAYIQGPWWSWDPTGGPVGVDNGDGTFSFTFDPAPTENMEFNFHVDGVSESLVGQEGDTCNAINTDYATYYNRFWLVGSGDQCYSFNSCEACP